MKPSVALPVVLIALLVGPIIPEPTSAAEPSTERRAVPKVSTAEAALYMRSALSRRFGSSFSFGYARKVKCMKRISRTRVRCQRISWNIGDVGYKGYGTIWFTKAQLGFFWNYAYRIVKTNYYCLNSDRPKKKCYERYIVR
jgi:hypothetical protein